MAPNGIKKPLVLLTGPNGYVGAHVLDQLLAIGYRVRGTVRSTAKAEFFRQKYANLALTDDDLSFTVVPDIQAEGALDEAMSDVTYACHVASPYFTVTTDPVKDLIEPAVNGTKNVMSSALKSTTLKRLTVVSSFAAVVDLAQNLRAGYVYTAADWNPVTVEQARRDGYYGYFASKTFAERAAWDMWTSADPKPTWDLVTFCPPMIYGPPIHEVDASKGVGGLNTSLRRMFMGIMGQDPAYAPRVAAFGLPAWVDVRDVALAHVRALALPLASEVNSTNAVNGHRLLLCSSMDNYEDGLSTLRRRGEKGLGLEGPRINRANHYSLDASEAQSLLGIKFRGFEETVTDTWDRVKELGII